MKIDGDKPSLRTDQPDATDRSERTATPPSGPGVPPTSTGRADQVLLSPDVQLVRTAMDTAAHTPDVRGDAVDRMRALLANGGVGTDAGRLADAIIDSWLNTL